MGAWYAMVFIMHSRTTKSSHVLSVTLAIYSEHIYRNTPSADVLHGAPSNNIQIRAFIFQLPSWHFKYELISVSAKDIDYSVFYLSEETSSVLYDYIIRKTNSYSSKFKKPAGNYFLWLLGPLNVSHNCKEKQACHKINTFNVLTYCQEKSLHKRPMSLIWATDKPPTILIQILMTDQTIRSVFT